FRRAGRGKSAPPVRRGESGSRYSRRLLSYSTPRAQVKERVGRTTLFSSSAMSSGRLFLDRADRHQSPSPLHRRDQNKLIARFEGTIYHQTVTSVLTGCLTFRDKRTTCCSSFTWRVDAPAWPGSHDILTRHGCSKWRATQPGRRDCWSSGDTSCTIAT